MTDESSHDRTPKRESRDSTRDTADAETKTGLSKQDRVLRQFGNQAVQRLARDGDLPRGLGTAGTGGSRHSNARADSRPDRPASEVSPGSTLTVSRVPTEAVIHRQVDQPRDEQGRFAEKDRPDSDKKYSIDRRPEYASGQAEAVWEAAKQAGLDNEVRDPNTGEVLTWDRSKSRFRQWHMGHKDGREYRVLLEYYLRDRISEERFKQEYQDPDHYRPEKPGPNMSGTYEGSGEYWQEEFGPLDKDGDTNE